MNRFEGENNNRCRQKKKQTQRPFSNSACSIPQESLSYSIGKQKRFFWPCIYLRQTVKQFNILQAKKQNKCGSEPTKHSFNQNLRKLVSQQQKICRPKKGYFRPKMKKRTHKKFLYDRFGNRIDIQQHGLNNLVNTDKLKRSELPGKGVRVFSAGKRINFSRPLNFNPGPGFYRIAGGTTSGKNSENDNLKKVKKVKNTKRLKATVTATEIQNQTNEQQNKSASSLSNAKTIIVSQENI